MSASNLFVLGLLLLTANLSLCALFAPSRSGNEAADRLVQLWKLLFLAMVEVGAWAVVLHQGGAAPTLLDTFTRCAACFALGGGEGGGFAPPWGEMKSFMALNGLLFIPVALIPWMTGAPAPRREPDISEELLQIPELPPLADPHASPEVSEPARQGAAGPSQGPLAPAGAAAPPPAEPVVAKVPDRAEPPASTVVGKPASQKADAPQPPPLPTVHAPTGHAPTPAPATALLPEQKPFGFRPTIPKVQSRLEPDSPEAELADQMKPVGPTPPPIRFRWNEEAR
jgi:hypothetical protein